MTHPIVPYPPCPGLPVLKPTVDGPWSATARAGRGFGICVAALNGGFHDRGGAVLRKALAGVFTLPWSSSLNWRRVGSLGPAAPTFFERSCQRVRRAGFGQTITKAVRPATFSIKGNSDDLVDRICTAMDVHCIAGMEVCLAAEDEVRHSSIAFRANCFMRDETLPRGATATGALGAGLAGLQIQRLIQSYHRLLLLRSLHPLDRRANVASQVTASLLGLRFPNREYRRACQQLERLGSASTKFPLLCFFGSRQCQN